MGTAAELQRVGRACSGPGEVAPDRMGQGQATQRPGQDPVVSALVSRPGARLERHDGSLHVERAEVGQPDRERRLGEQYGVVGGLGQVSGPFGGVASSAEIAGGDTDLGVQLPATGPDRGRCAGGRIGEEPLEVEVALELRGHLRGQCEVAAMAQHEGLTPRIEIADRPCKVDRACGVAGSGRRVVIAEVGQGAGEVQLDGGLLGGRGRRVGGDVEREIGVPAGFGPGSDLGGDGHGASGVLEQQWSRRLGAGPAEMMGDQEGSSVVGIGRAVEEAIGDVEVEVAPRPTGLTAGQHLANETVTEVVGPVGPLDEEPGQFELGDRGIERLGLITDHVSEIVERLTVTEMRRNRQYPAGRLAHPVHPLSDHIVEFGGRRRHLAHGDDLAVLDGERTRVAEVVDQVPDEQWVPLGDLEDLGEQPARRRLLEHRLEQAVDRQLVEVADPEVTMRRFAAQTMEESEDGSALHRPAAQHHEQGHGLEQCGASDRGQDVRHEVEGGRIRPVEVVDVENDPPFAGGPQDLVGDAHEQLGGAIDDRGDLVGDQRRTRCIRPQRGQQREVRHREVLVTHPGEHVGAGGLPLGHHRIRQGGLPDAGVTAQDDDPRIPVPCLGRPLLERMPLGPTPDELPGAALGGRKERLHRTRTYSAFAPLFRDLPSLALVALVPLIVESRSV